MAGGGPISQLQSQQQTPMGGGSSPLNTGGGMSGGQTQLPNFAAPQQQPMQTQMAVPGALYPSQFMNYGQQQPMPQPIGIGQQQQPNANIMQGAFGNLARAALGAKQLPQQPDSSMVAEEYPTASFGDMQNRVQRPPPMQNPFQPQQPTNRGQFEIYTPQHYQQQQPQQPSFMQDPEYQGYQTQANDLQRQMNEYMQKAPMYQQLQDLQGKMAPFQQRYQQQQDMQRMQQQRQAMQQRQFQQPSPFRRGQYLQPQGLMGLLGGRGMPQAQSPMYAEFPQNFGREQQYSVPAYSANYSGMSSATRAAMEAEAAKAAQAAAPAFDNSYYNNSGW